MRVGIGNNSMNGKREGQEVRVSVSDKKRLLSNRLIFAFLLYGQMLPQKNERKERTVNSQKLFKI
jgi:hypothetical protein